MTAASVTNYQICNPNQPMVDPTTGKISREWWQFFSQLSGDAGSGQGLPASSPSKSIEIETTPGSLQLDQQTPITQVLAPARTYLALDRGGVFIRSNSGSAMFDTMPATVPLNGWFTRIVNVDATGVLTIRPTSGTNINGVLNGAYTLNPSTDVAVVSDGAGYWTEGGSSTVAVLQFSASIQIGGAGFPAIANDTYYFSPGFPRNAVIQSARAYVVGSGTATVEIDIASTPVTGLVALAATTTSTGPVAATGANTVVVGNAVTAVVTSASIGGGNKLLLQIDYSTSTAVTTYAASLQLGGVGSGPINNDTYYFDGGFPRNATIVSAYAFVVGSGTATVSIQINNNPVGGLGALAVTTSSTGAVAATSPAFITVGNPVTAVVTSAAISAGNKLVLQINYV